MSITTAGSRWNRLLAVRARLATLLARRTQAASLPLRAEALEDRLVPDGSRPLPLPVIFMGSGGGPGSSPLIRAYAADTGTLNFEQTVFEPGFTGGVRVAVGDFTRDGYPDAVVAAGPGGGPRARILDDHTGEQIAGPLGSFWAFDESFTGGLNVAAGDVDGDGVPDVIAAAGPGRGPHVKVYSGATGAEFASFFAYDPAFEGGVTVVAADLTGDHRAEVAVGAGEGGGPSVKVYDPTTWAPLGAPLGSFFAFAPDFRGGVTVSADALAGDVDGDGTPDLAVESGPGMAGEVKVYSGATGAMLRDFAPFGPEMTGGVRVALSYADDDPHADLVTGTGPGGPATVRVFSGATGAQLPPPTGEYTPFGPDATGGVYVAASNDPVPMDLIGAYDVTAKPGVSTGDVVLGDFWENDWTPDAVDHTVEVDWGDGTTSAGYTVETSYDGLDQSSYAIHGSHTYADVGTYDVTVTITHIAGGTLTALLQAQVVLPVVTVSANGSPVEGGNAPTWFAFQRTGDLNTPLTVRYKVVGGSRMDTGMNGIDFQALPGTTAVDGSDPVPDRIGSVSFGPGDRFASAFLTVTNDNLTEYDENVTVVVLPDDPPPGTPARYAVGGSDTATLTIRDNDDPVLSSTLLDKIPVNANDDNATINPTTRDTWKSADQPYIPYKRDFDAVNLPVDDPQLIPLTLTVSPRAYALSSHYLQRSYVDGLAIFRDLVVVTPYSRTT